MVLISDYQPGVLEIAYCTARGYVRIKAAQLIFKYIHIFVLERKINSQIGFQMSVMLIFRKVIVTVTPGWLRGTQRGLVGTSDQSDIIHYYVNITNIDF